MDPTDSTSDRRVVRATPLQKGMLLAASLLVGMVALEIMITLSGLAPDVTRVERGRYRLSANPKIGYEPIPGVEYDEENLEFYDYRGSSNSLGFRDREHAVAKASGAFRVIVLGDSVAAGLKVTEFEDTFPALLEKRLRRTDPGSEVMSFAVSGYNTQQEVETLRVKGLPYGPDLVVLAYCLNDTASFTDLLDALLTRAGEGERLGLAMVNPWLVKSALYRFVRYRIQPLLTGRDDAVRADDYADLAKDTVEASFGELATMARDAGFEVLVVVFPPFHDLVDYPHHHIHTVMSYLAEDNGFHYLDLLPAFQECLKESDGPLSHDSYHPTALGHRCAATAAAGDIEAIRERRRAADAGP